MQLGGYIPNPDTTFLNGPLCNDAPIKVSDSFLSNPPSICQGKHVSTECRRGAMLDESKLGRPSPEPVKRARKRSNGRLQLKSAASGANGSHRQSDASSTDNSPSKLEPESQPTGLQNKSKEAIASDDTFVVRIGGSTVTLNYDLRIFGTNNEDSTHTLARQLANVVLNAEGKHDLQNLKWALPIMHGIGPKDELEGLLAVQMLGIHTLTIECLKRASMEGQTTVEMDANVNHVTKLARTFTMQIEALNRHRGKVGQQLVVGNVNVNEGGQAIVGRVSHGGRGKASTEVDADKLK